MSQPNSNFGDDNMFEAEAADEMGPPVTQAPLYRKQGFSIYTMLLILSFFALTTAAILAFMDVGKFSQ